MNTKSFLVKSLALLLSAIALGSIVAGFRNSEDPRIEKILKQIGVFSNRSNLQKIYIKTDKDRYFVGETIWLKAYLLKATDLKTDIGSNEIFVDLIGRNNTVVQSIILKNEGGVAHGDISVYDSIPNGIYQLVAYTNWMKNFDDEYFFSKTIKIENPSYSNYITTSALLEIKNYNKEIKNAEEEKTVQFFPEGGTFVAGIQSRLAFKAINGLGNGVHVTGEIFDNADTRICKFESKHLGMGVINFTPEAGKTYYAKTLFDDGTSAKISLPNCEPKGYVLMANAIAGDQIRVNIQSNITTQPDQKDNEFIIIGQSRGEARYVSKGVFKGKPVNTNIPKNLFPAGIAQITLFNGKGEPVCERLVFIQPKDNTAKASMSVEKLSEGNDIVYKIDLKQAEGKPISGNLTLAVYETLKESSSFNWNENMLSNLLLTSDLKGRVENAGDYFNNSNPEAVMDIDLVMMVNGWRRFAWKEILAGQFTPLLYAQSEGIKENEVSTTSIKPFSVKLGDKAFNQILNEEYDQKQVRKNSRNAKVYNTGNIEENRANIVKINHNVLNSYPDMIEYLRGRVAGVTVTNNGIIIRGINSFTAGTDPLILQDNSQIGFSTLKMISPIDVSSVEVLKGSDASIYGSRGANGVIIIHMRRADEYNSKPLENTEEYPERIISFYKAREFYVPAYDSWNVKPSEFNIPRSVYWKPNIVIDSTGIATIRFRKRADIGNITTSIEGITSDGTVLSYKTEN